MKPETQLIHNIQLGMFTYCVRRGLVLDIDGRSVKLRPQTSKVLAVLARQPGKTVTKEELIAEVWPLVSVTDDSITQCIADIRKALRDERREILCTLPKVGYSLCPTESADVNALSDNASTSKKLMSIAQEIFQGTYPKETAFGDLLPTVAILPFQQVETNDDLGIACELLVSDINSELSRSWDVAVISQLSTQYNDVLPLNLRELSQSLNAQFILSGRCRMVPGEIVVVLDFCDAHSGKVMWSDEKPISIGTHLDDSDVVHQVVARIRQSISLAETDRASMRPPQTLKNYTLLSSAVRLMHRLSRPDFEKAREMLEILISRNPDNPIVLAWMAQWHVMLVQQGWSSEANYEAGQALKNSMRALEVDPECTLALVSQASVLVNLSQDLDEAELLYNAALETRPSCSLAWLFRGALRSFQGKGASAVTDVERAINLSPQDPNRFLYLALAASAHLANNEHETALNYANASYRLNRTHASTLRVKSVAQMRLGNVSDAYITCNELMDIQPSLTVSGWLKSAPSSNYQIGRDFAVTLREIGVPK